VAQPLLNRLKMKFAENIEIAALPAEAKHTVRLPLGLLGFERVKEVLLLANPTEAPFLWLQLPDDASLAFLVVNPFLIAPDYSPDIPGEDAEFLGLRGPEEALLFNIVTLHGSSQATVNLKGPIVLNRRTLTGKQVVLNNAAEYSVQHPLPVVN
jgi:flagellar assembly factor FliW